MNNIAILLTSLLFACSPEKAPQKHTLVVPISIDKNVTDSINEGISTCEAAFLRSPVYQSNAKLVSTNSAALNDALVASISYPVTVSLGTATVRFGIENELFFADTTAPSWASTVTISSLPSDSRWDTTYFAWQTDGFVSQSLFWIYDEVDTVVEWPLAPDDNIIKSSFRILKKYECTNGDFLTSHSESFREAKTRNDQQHWGESYQVIKEGVTTSLSASSETEGTKVVACVGLNCTSTWGTNWGQVRKNLVEVEVYKTVQQKEFRLAFIPPALIDVLLAVKKKGLN